MAKYETVASFVTAVKAINFDNLDDAMRKLQDLLPDRGDEVRQWCADNPLLTNMESALSNGTFPLPRSTRRI
jgi:hypothetical protein